MQHLEQTLGRFYSHFSREKEEAERELDTLHSQIKRITPVDRESLLVPQLEEKKYSRIVEIIKSFLIKPLFSFLQSR
jgi:hypothetical protein